MKHLILIGFLLLPAYLFPQTKGRVTGTLKDKNTQISLAGATFLLIGKDTVYAQSDQEGNFSMDAPVGNYQLEITMIGYSPVYLYNLNLNAGNAQVLQIEMEPRSTTIGEVAIRFSSSARATDMITPLSTQKLTAEEIKFSPGGNFDVSKVIQVLPGVAGGTSANRNDIIVRGGGPSENVYYLDGIEIPVLNHFQTQGASGGATGILNVSFINDVQLTSSAFDSRYDNALASTFVIKQRNGDPERFAGNVRLSGSEFATTLEGPLGSRTTFLASARRSYLQFLFKLLDLPIRPDYWDFQYKVHHRFDDRTELSLIGLGAIDHFRLAVPRDADEENAYILRANPLINQWNYTTGASLKRLTDNGFYTVALSRNMLFNGVDRYENNAAPSGNKLFSLGSHEAENKLRVDVSQFLNGWKLGFGGGVQYVRYDAELFNTASPGVSYSNETAIDFFKIGAYLHTSKYVWDDRLLLSGGVRSDVNTYTGPGLNPLETLSPRLSVSYKWTNQWNVSASVGTYFKLPPYTALGYRTTGGQLANKDLDYIRSTHYTVGTQYVPRNDFRFTAEAFYKHYSNYPVSGITGISMANIGTDFSAIGSEPYLSTGKGSVYGMEVYAQQKLIRKVFYVASATLYRSAFTGLDDRYRSSTWDYGYIVSAAIGYKPGRNWDMGLKYRIAGGQPYTPFDAEASRAAYLTTGQGVYDYSQLNAERLPVFQQLDLRVDKKFDFRRTSLVVFADIQNVLMQKTSSLPKYTFRLNGDQSGFETTDGLPVASDGRNAIPRILDQRSATVVPSLGFIFEF